MPRRKAPQIPDVMLDHLLSGTKASAAFEQGGLLDQLKKALAERALNAEMDHHLAGDGGAGNSRNGYGRKNVVTDSGRMALEVPRDRQGSFEPLLIAKYQRRFPGFDDKLSNAVRSTDVRAGYEHVRDRRSPAGFIRCRGLGGPRQHGDGRGAGRFGALPRRRPGKRGRWSRSTRWYSSTRCG